MTYSETETGTYVATNPVYANAGTYTVYYKVARTGYNDAAGSAVVTINQKAVGLTWGETSFAYDGASKLPTATATGLVNGDACTVTVDGAQTDVGSYTATASALSNTNYTLPRENTVSFSIVPGTQDSVSAEDYAGTYDGAAHSVTVTASNGGTVTYSEAQDGEYSAENPSYTNAGTYTVYYKVTKAGYNDATGSANVKISKKSVTVSAITAADKTYDGTATAELVTADVAFEGRLSDDSLSVTGTAAFADADAGDSKTVNVSDLTLSGTSAENYTLSSDTASGTGKIMKRPISITAANQTVSLGGTIGQGTDKVSISSGSLVTGHSVSAVTLTATDTANATASGAITPSGAKISSGGADVTANYEITYANGVLTVREGAPAVTAPTEKTGLAYTGSPQELVNAGSVEGGAMEYALGTDSATAPATGYSVEVPKGTDVGMYYIWYKVTGDSNHSDVAAACVTVTIGKGTPTVVAPTANTLTYDDTAKTLVAAGSSTGGALEYAPGTDGTTVPASGWGTAIPTGTDAGTYYVWYRVTGGDNYNDVAASSVTAVIGKKAATVTANAQAVNLNGTIDTALANALLSGAVDGHTLSAVTLTGSSAANATASGTIIPSAAKIVSGETDVTANYEITYVNGVLTVNKGASGVTAPTAKTLMYSGAAQELVTAGTATGGTMQYAPGTDGTAAPRDGYGTDIPTGTDAGTYYVWYKVVGDSNHSDTDAEKKHLE